MPPAHLPALARGPLEVGHSGIREITNLAMARPGTIRLDVGQPDFFTPEHIREAGRRAIAEGYTFYTQTAGLPSLRELLAAKIRRVNGYPAPPADITVGPGGVGILAAFFAALLEAGDEVLLPDPGWPNYRMMCSWLGARPAYYRCPPAALFQPDLEHLESLIGARTRVVVVNSPNNPTGAVYPESTLGHLVEIAERHGLWIISDECYDQISFEGPVPSLGALDRAGRVLSAYTFSKTYAMTGWRLGYGTGPSAAIDSAVKVLESNSSCASTISQIAAEGALAGPQECVAEMVEAYRARRDVAVELLREAGLLISRPTGAFYIMADVSGSGLEAREFAFRLLDAAGVSVAPGTAFGSEAAGAVRISLASAESELRTGIGRLAEFVRAGDS